MLKKLKLMKQLASKLAKIHSFASLLHSFGVLRFNLSPATRT